MPVDFRSTEDAGLSQPDMIEFEMHAIFIFMHMCLCGIYDSVAVIYLLFYSLFTEDPLVQ